MLQKSCGSSGISISVYTSHGQVQAEEGQKPTPEITQPTSPDGPAEVSHNYNTCTSNIIIIISVQVYKI